MEVGGSLWQGGARRPAADMDDLNARRCWHAALLVFVKVIICAMLIYSLCVVSADRASANTCFM